MGCQNFASGPLSDPAVIAASKDFIPVFVDTLADHATTRRFGEHFGSYPVLRVQDTGGAELAGRLDGNPVAGQLPTRAVLEQMKLGLTRFRSK